MLKNKQIVILSTDYLQAYGLKQLLEEYFTPDKVELVTSCSALENEQLNSDILFIHAAILYVVYERVASLRSKVIILSDKFVEDQVSGFPVLHAQQEQTELLEELHGLLADKLQNQIQKNKLLESRMELTDREREVLALIAKGDMNKTIADKLAISLNTVLSHRKNITGKLGIKTVSGLTVYAILNGLISADEV